ncbi:hypothetical protein [Mesohalobacter halotolerans]|uniref:Uncharacterized protein n=1 Tax=Mesohalobacter halotolerans TaxID=1883405 RepID=A0A4U5TRK8_9FLAO|nr:hypothetical protein [Mesohalobacter halotolerans]MBS3739194.1 hypothetical protein [Psychroflexus sp.]TKS56024.1 hypothetical protein FCN74_08335 [Mesohalobacter halotolerans]
MSQTLEVVKQLESHVFKLVNKFDTLKEDLNTSESENQKLKDKIKTLKHQISILTTENEQLKTANAILGSKNYKKETKLKINRLIREVDSCIVQLSK